MVYGGGGITPDHIVRAAELNDFQDRIAKHFVFFTFVRDFLADNPTIDPSFEVSDEMLADFEVHAIERDIEISHGEVAANADYLKRMIKHEVFYNRIGVADAQRVRLRGDVQILRALELMSEARELATQSRNQ